MASGGKKKSRAKAPARMPAQAGKASTAPAFDTGEMSVAERVVWVCLHLLVFLVPIAMTNANWIARLFQVLNGPTGIINAFAIPFTYDQFDIAKVFVMRAAALIGAGAWGFSFFMRGGKLRRTKVDWLVLIFLGWVLLTSFTSISPATAFFGKYRRFEGFFSFCTYAVVWFLAVQVIDRPSRMRSIARTLLLSGSLVAFYGLLQAVGQVTIFGSVITLDPIWWGTTLPFEVNRSFSTFGNPDLLGGFLVFPLAIAPAMALSERRIGWRVTYWAIFLLTVACWITAYVRGAWIGGAVAVAALLVAFFLARTKEPVAPGIAAVDWSFGAVTVAATGFLLWKSSQSTSDVLNVVTRLGSILKFGEGSAKTRFEIWQAAWDAIKTRPILGYGADTFRLVFPEFKPAAYTRDAGYLSVADNVHNYPLQLGSALGVPGFLLLYGLFGWALWLGLPNAFSRGKGLDRLVLSGFWAAAIGYIVHLMFGLSVTGSTVFLWLAFAVILAPTARVVEVRMPNWGQIVAVTTAAAAVALSIGNVVWFTADHYYLQAQFPDSGSSTATPLESIRTAISLNPYNDMYRTWLGEVYKNQMNAWMAEARRLKNAGQAYQTAYDNGFNAFKSAESAYLDVRSFVPTEYDNYVFLGSLYNLGGQMYSPSYFDQAVAIAKDGIRVEPNGPAIRFQLALAYYNKGVAQDPKYLDEAVSVLKGTIDMDPLYWEPKQLLGDIYRAQGRRAEAIAMYEAVRAVNPNDTLALEGLRALGATVTPGATGTPVATPTP